MFDLRIGCERRWTVPEPQQISCREMILDRTATATADKLTAAGGYPGWFPIEPAMIEVLPDNVAMWLDTRARGWRMLDRVRYPDGIAVAAVDTVLLFRSKAVRDYFRKRFSDFLISREIAHREFLSDLAEAIADASFEWLKSSARGHRYRRARSFLDAERAARARFRELQAVKSQRFDR